MKSSHKQILKSILLSSIATLGTSPANASQTVPAVTYSKKEVGSDSESLGKAARV